MSAEESVADEEVLLRVCREVGGVSLSLSSNRLRSLLNLVARDFFWRKVSVSVCSERV